MRNLIKTIKKYGVYWTEIICREWVAVNWL